MENLLRSISCPRFGDNPSYQYALEWQDSLKNLETTGSEIKLEYAEKELSSIEAAILTVETKLANQFKTASVILAALIALGQLQNSLPFLAYPSLLLMICVMLLTTTGLLVVKRPTTFDPQSFISISGESLTKERLELYLAGSHATAAIGHRPILAWKAKWQRMATLCLTIGLILLPLILISV